MREDEKVHKPECNGMMPCTIEKLSMFDQWKAPLDSMNTVGL